jgi:hypothetical protein
MKRRIVVGFSGGVTSAWCAGWALRTFPRNEVILLWHDTKEEHPDTYRFLREMAAALDMPITERSDGRSVTEVFRDEGYLGNNQNAMCSRILKAEQGSAFIRGLQGQGFAVSKVFGYSARERERVARMVGYGLAEDFVPLFPIIQEGVSKQQCADWCISMGVRPSAMYEWADHANCIGCVKGGKEYWLAVAKHHPDVFAQRAALEAEFGDNSILRGGGREHPLLRDLVQIGLKRKVNRREAIQLGPCECGD